MSSYRFLGLKVRDYMTAEPQSVSPDLCLGDLEALFERHRFNAFPVVAEGRLVGVVTQLDFLKAFGFTTAQIVPHYNELMQLPVHKVMSAAVVAVGGDWPLTRALQLMVELRARSFPVVAGETLIGIITREDIMRALKEAAAA